MPLKTGEWRQFAVRSISPGQPEKLDLTLVPIFLIAIVCIGIGTYLSGVQKAGFSTDENRRISTDSDSCVVIDQEEEEDEQKFTSKQVLSKLFGDRISVRAINLQGV